MLHNKPVIGLCGGVGSGKSVVARCLGGLGCGVIDSDALSREAMGLESSVAQVRAWWGDGVIGEDGKVDRGAIGKIVFGDAEAKGMLEGLIHPLVEVGRERLRAAYLADDDVVGIVEDCPLLYEVGIDKGCDCVIFVRSRVSDREGRVQKNRGWEAGEVVNRENLQIALDIKAKKADYIVENDSTVSECEARVRAIFSQILHRYPQS